MRPSERLTAGFLCAIAVLALAARAPLSALAFVAVAAATVILARTAANGPARPVRDFFPVAAVIATYLLLEPAIVGLNGARWDAALAAFDDRHLAGLVASW